jgi:hypothetical protein
MSDDKPEVHITGMDEEDAYRYLDATQNKTLKELVDKWKEDADNPNLSQMARQRTWEDAKELEKVINE